MAPSKSYTARKEKISSTRPSASSLPLSELASGSIAKKDQASAENTFIFKLQQDLLSVFVAAVPDLLDPNTHGQTLEPLVQRVKHFLYERDFASAFGNPELLDAYAARWSSSRALAYFDILTEVCKHLEPTMSSDTVPREVRISCLGGGAGAELVGTSGLLGLREREAAQAEGLPVRINVDCVDSADWSSTLHRLHEAVLSGNISPPEIPLHFSMHSIQADLLDGKHYQKGAAIASSISSAHLITLFFTLNELYHTSMSRTQTFLLDLTRLVQLGCLLLVVDSPGSYSTVTIGAANNEREASEAQREFKTREPRKYPMAWLLDHALLRMAAQLDSGENDAIALGPWEKMQTVESRWFRLPEGLQYPIALENMRYQLHLFRRRST